MACDTQPNCIVDDRVASLRLSLYNGRKLQDMNQCHPNGKEIDLPTHTVNAFLKVLQFIADSKAPYYDGMRVYPAAFPSSTTVPGGQHVPNGHLSCMTLIYVPTCMVNGVPGTDDLSHCMLITEDDYVTLPDPRTSSAWDDIASAWVVNFRNKLDKLERLGSTFTGEAFHETRNMWYPIKTLIGDLTDPGLISYLTCLKNLPPDQNPADRIKPKLACYLQDDSLVGVFYQLTLLFGIHRVNDEPKVVSFVGTPGGGPGKPEADTGLPCPPNKGCQQQSLLPAGH